MTSGTKFSFWSDKMVTIEGWMQKLSLLFQLIQPPPILNKNRKSAPETILAPKLNKLEQKIFLHFNTKG